MSWFFLGLTVVSCMHNPGRDLASVAADPGFNNPFYTPPYMLEDYYRKGAFASEDIDYGRSLCQLKLEAGEAQINNVMVKTYTFDISKELTDTATSVARGAHQRQPSSIDSIHFAWPSDGKNIGVDNKMMNKENGVDIEIVTRFYKKDADFVKEVVTTHPKRGVVTLSQITVEATPNLSTIYSVTFEESHGKKGQSPEKMELQQRIACANASF